MTEPPFTLAAIEAMSIAEMDALDAEAIDTAAATIPSLDEEALGEFIAALDLLKEHKQYAAADAYHEGTSSCRSGSPPRRMLRLRRWLRPEQRFRNADGQTHV